MRYALLLVGAVVFLSGCTSAESWAKPGYDFSALKTVAVVEVNGADVLQAGQVGDDFVMELIARGYNVVEREKLDSIMQEQKLQGSGVVQPSGAGELGKLAGADAVMVVTVPQMDHEFQISAKMIETKTGMVIMVGSGSGTTHHGLTTALGAGVGIVAGAGMGRHAAGHHWRGTGTVLGAVAGGAVGGAVGYALEPAAEPLVRKLVKKICADLPGMNGPVTQ